MLIILMFAVGAFIGGCGWICFEFYDWNKF